MTAELAPHGWNTGFVWRDHTGPFTTLTDEQIAQFDRDGFVVIPDAYDADVLARLIEEIEPGVDLVRGLLEQLPGGRISVAGLDTQIVAPHLVGRSDYLRRFCADELLVGICRDLMGPDVRLYWEQAVYKQPHGAEPVLWHQDNGYTFVEPQDYLTVWLALTDATLDNGCISVMPGHHRLGTLAHAETPIGFECAGDHDIAVDVPVRAGSLVIFSSLSPHATRINATDTVRKAYIIQYAHDGASGRQGDPSTGDGVAVPLDEPTRQFVVLRDGRRVEPA